ncbi:MAG: N-methyl-D-aspartate receptor NMDAR2C subunit, partial [Desulfobacteraceae bacterium]|nr:N-methyl-D-aspartate receptor NMDAR2C subunit [Desulfobacteraceae bacterium]
IALLKRLGSTTDPGPLYGRLIEAYSEKHRAYHDLKHLEHCLAEFDQIRDQLKSPDEVEMAIWYHDAVYQIGSNNNEEKSAQLARTELKRAGIKDTSVNTVEILILATKHNGSVVDPDTQYLIDIDLSTFGSPPVVYQEYENKIRKEHEWVPYSIYKTKRKEVLNSFFKKDPIYYTNFFNTKYEKQARTNLKLAIDALET